MFHTLVLCAMSDDVVLCVARVTQRNTEESTAKFQKGSVIIFFSASYLLMKYFARILLRKPSSSLKLLVQVWRLNKMIQSCSSDLLLLKDRCSITLTCFQYLYHGLSCSYLEPPFLCLHSVYLYQNLNL